MGGLLGGLARWRMAIVGMADGGHLLTLSMVQNVAVTKVVLIGGPNS